MANEWGVIIPTKDFGLTCSGRSDFTISQAKFEHGYYSVSSACRNYFTPLFFDRFRKSENPSMTTGYDRCLSWGYGYVPLCT